jgi:nuclear pore complex protein Nup98-Nup96
MCSVYEDSEKHSLGVGLNCPAEIILNNCFPVDKKTKTPLRDAESVSRHTERLKTTVQGTKFIRYDVQSGTWTFQVEHFSRYGLVDNEYDTDQEMKQSSPIASPATSALMDMSEHEAPLKMKNVRY